MRNKLLLLIIIVLLPIVIFNNYKEAKKEEVVDEKKEIVVKLSKNNEILDLNINDYLIGVVGQEMPASFNYEALKAQAVAARTFAYNNLSENVINISDSAQHYISTDEMKEKWNDKFEDYYNKIKDAVFETNDEVIKYNNNIIKSYYYAISNGKTEDSLAVFNEELPYIQVVDSKFDEEVNSFKVSKNYTKEEFCKLLSINPCNISIEDIKRDESDRVSLITINNKVYKGTDIRKALNIRSTDFTININEDNVVVTTKGYGHGVGMSQYGANYLANNGYNYQDILKYYYKDVEVEKY